MDRVFKIWVASRLEEAESIPVWKGVFHLTRVNNKGAAFGLWRNASWFLTAVTALSVFVILVYFARTAPSEGKTNKNFHAWALVAGGALGNLYDRLSLGYVIDFLDFRVWPVFNIADSAICLGVLLILWNMSHAPDPH